MTSLICPNHRCKQLVAVVDRTVERHSIPGSTEECPISGTYYKPQKVGSKYDGEVVESPVRLVSLGMARCPHGQSYPAAEIAINKQWLSDVSHAETDPSKVN